jgi:hypothetical protein
MGATCCAWFEGAAGRLLGALEAHPGPLELIGFVVATGKGDAGDAAVAQGDSAGAAG